MPTNELETSGPDLQDQKQNQWKKNERFDDFKAFCRVSMVNSNDQKNSISYKQSDDGDHL